MEGTLHYRGVRTSATDVRMDVCGAVRLGRVGEEAVVRTDNGAIAHMDKKWRLSKRFEEKWLLQMGDPSSYQSCGECSCCRASRLATTCKDLLQVGRVASRTRRTVAWFGEEPVTVPQRLSPGGTECPRRRGDDTQPQLLYPIKRIIALKG